MKLDCSFLPSAKSRLEMACKVLLICSFIVSCLITGSLQLDCYSCSNLQLTSDTTPGAAPNLGPPDANCGTSNTSTFNRATCTAGGSGETALCITGNGLTKFTVWANNSIVGLDGVSRLCTTWNSSITPVPNDGCYDYTTTVAQAVGSGGSEANAIIQTTGQICICRSNLCNSAAAPSGSTTTPTDTTAAPGTGNTGAPAAVRQPLLHVLTWAAVAWSCLNKLN